MRRPSVLFLVSAVAAPLAFASPVLADVVELKPELAAEWGGAGKDSPAPYVKGNRLRGQIRWRKDRTAFLFTPAVRQADGSFASATEPVTVKLKWVKRVRQEVDTHLDLDAMISNRDSIQSAVEDAYRDIERTIDPTRGASVFDKAPAGPKRPQAPALLEGWLVRVLGRGPMRSPADRTRLVQENDTMLGNVPPEHRDPFDPFLTERTPEDVTTALVEALSRAWKYGYAQGEPGLADRITDVAWLVTERLARASREGAEAAGSPDAPGAGGVAFRCRDFALRARSTIVTLIEAGAPEAKDQPFGGPDPEMPLAGGEISEAATWLAASMVTPREETPKLVEALLRVAGQSDTSEWTLARDALVVLSLEDKPWPYKAPPEDVAPGSDGRYRSRVLAHLDSTDSRRARAAQDVMILTGGPATADELARVVDDLFRVAVPPKRPATARERARRDAAVRTLLLLTRVGKEKLKAVELVDRRIGEIRAREEAGTASEGERDFLSLVKPVR